MCYVQDVRKMQLPFVLFALLIYLRRIIFQSILSTAPTYGDSRGIAGVLGAGQLLFECPRSAREVWGYNIGTLTLLGFSVV